MAKRIVWTDQAKADVRGIEQPIAIQILKTLGRYVLTGEGALHLVAAGPPWAKAQGYRTKPPEGGCLLPSPLQGALFISPGLQPRAGPPRPTALRSGPAPPRCSMNRGIV